MNELTIFDFFLDDETVTIEFAFKHNIEHSAITFEIWRFCEIWAASLGKIPVSVLELEENFMLFGSDISDVVRKFIEETYFEFMAPVVYSQGRFQSGNEEIFEIIEINPN